MAGSISGGKVRLQTLVNTSELKQRKKLKSFIRQVFARHAKVLEDLTVIFCDDEYLLNINRQFLHHDFYTDIISFDLSEPNSGLIGEIYISVERTRENAFHHSITRVHELHRVIFHGILHFCGFTDKSPRAKREMTTQEDKLLRAYGKFVPHGTRST